MPYFQDPEQDPNKQQQQAGFQVSGAAPAAGGANPPGQTQQQGAAPKPEKTGSNFQNLDKYVQANQGQNFGNKVVGKVQGDVNKAGQSMQDAAGSFSAKVNQNQAYGKDQVDAALNDPSKANAAQFQAGIDQQYKGPKSLAESQDDYNKFTGDTSKAQTAANELSTEGGRFALLDNYFGRANYGFGQKSLDNALVQSTPGIGQQTNAVQSQAHGLQSQGKQMQDQLQSQASQRSGDIEQARNYQRGQLGLDANGQVVSGQGAFGGLQKNLADQLSSQNAARTQNQQSLQQELAAGNDKGYDLSDQQIDQLKQQGLDTSGSTYGVNLGDYIHNSGALNMDQTATDDQRARLSALNGLVGQGYAQNMLGDKQAANQDFTFDKDRYANDVATAQRGAQANVDQAQSGINEIAGDVELFNKYYNPRDAFGAPIDIGASRAAINGEMQKRFDAQKAAQARQAALAGMRIY